MVTQSAAIHIEDLAPLLVSPDVADRFYKYKGSLTTPGCYESVTWFVMNNHPQITEKEVSKNCATAICSPVHTIPERFLNGVFTPKTQLVFFVHTTPKKFENGKIAGT